MKRITLSLVAVAALVFVGFDTKSAEAAHGFGFHYGGPFFHVDIGKPHGNSWGESHHAGRHHVGRHHVRRPAPVHYDWHNTSHFDYVPTRSVWHGNHYDHVPARLEYHHTGHWDRHRGYHH